MTDRRTGSSAEFVSGLRRHPKVKYVGENTHGCGEYGDTATALLPNGGYLNMGIYKNELFAGIREGEGLAPTHRTPPGRDAFDHCMQLMQYDLPENGFPPVCRSIPNLPGRRNGQTYPAAGSKTVISAERTVFLQALKRRAFVDIPRKMII